MARSGMQLAIFALTMAFAVSSVTAADCRDSSTVLTSDVAALSTAVAANNLNPPFSNPDFVLVDGIDSNSLQLGTVQACYFRHNNGDNLFGSTHIKTSDMAFALNDIISQCCLGQFCEGIFNIKGDQGDNVNLVLQPAFTGC